jgi:hypothetical protein
MVLRATLVARDAAATATRGDRLSRHVQPATALVEQGTDSLVAGANGVLIDHEPTVCSVHRVGKPAQARRLKTIRLFLGVA